MTHPRGRDPAGHHSETCGCTSTFGRAEPMFKREDLRMLIARATAGPEDRFGATEINGLQIEAIDCCDSLGYQGVGREEHSGENSPRVFTDLRDELADNDAAQMAAGDLVGAGK